MSEDVAEAVRQRHALEGALLQKFASGRRLEPAEATELEHLLPAGVLSSPPEPQPDYIHTYAHYAGLLACTERHIKRYVTIGRRAQPFADFPPFDQPAEFLGWWRRHKKREAPPHVLAFVALGRTKGSGNTGPLSDEKGVSIPDPLAATAGGSPLRFQFAGAGGFEESVRELRATVAAGQNRLRRAMESATPDECLVAACNRAVREQLDLLRKAENDLFDMQQKRGDLVPRSEIREDWRTLLSAMRQMRRRMEDNVVAHLSKSALFPPELLERVREAVGLERAREDQLLRGAKHWREDPSDGPAETVAAA